MRTFFKRTLYNTLVHIPHDLIGPSRDQGFIRALQDLVRVVQSLDEPHFYAKKNTLACIGNVFISTAHPDQ